MSKAVRHSSRPQPNTHARTLNMDMLNEHLGFALNRALLLLRRDFFEQFDHADMRPSMFSVLVLIGANPGVLPTELADTLYLEKASVTNLLKELQRREWIESHVRHDDLRCKGIYLSPDGARELIQLKMNVAVHAEKFDAIYTPLEKLQLIKLLQRIE
jgi:DNA-binding MarR family transcriptional regulator